MTKEELKIELAKLGVRESNYSLNEGLKIDAMILEDLGGGLYKSFYYDEKGNDSDMNLHKSEVDAYKSLLDNFKEELRLLGKDRFEYF